MTKYRIGITSSIGLDVDDWLEFANDQTPRQFSACLRAKACLPFIIPTGTTSEEAEAYMAHLDGVIFTGGSDINPLLYNEEPSMKLHQTKWERDQWEKRLFEACENNKKPMLAVCRGMQLINVLLGGKLYQDLSEIDQSPIVQHIKNGSRYIYPQHTAEIDPHSFLGQIFPEQDTIFINSYHHQAVKTLGNDLKKIAWAKDGIVEAYERQGSFELAPILGIQWHPEVMAMASKEMENIFSWFNHVI